MQSVLESAIAVHSKYVNQTMEMKAETNSFGGGICSKILKKSYSRSKKPAHIVSKSVSFRADAFTEGAWSAISKQEVTKLVLREGNGEHSSKCTNST